MQLQRPSQRLRATIHVVLILMLAYGLAQLTWRLLPSQTIEAPRPLTAGSGKSVSASPDDRLQQLIPSWHLFGKYEAAAIKLAEPVPEDLPETKLRLTLRGVIASPDAEVARAIVADQAKKENFYKIGDKLPGNAELTEIHGDRIIIKRGINYETLKLPKESLKLETSSEKAASNRRTRPGQAQSPAASSQPARRPSSSYSLKEYRDTLLTDPQKVSDLVRLSQANRNGKFIGYKLSPGRDPRFLSRYGLMPGDIVTEINGVVLDGPTKGFALMKDIETVDTLQLTVDRNGSLQRFTLPIN